MAEQKKRTTPFVPPKSFKEAGKRLITALGAFGERQARRMSPQTFAAADRRRAAEKKRREAPRPRPAPSEFFKSNQLTAEINQMLGGPVTQEPGLVSAPATPAAPTATPTAVAGPVAGARARQSEKRRERLRMQGFTEAEIQELEPGN